jgi:hypothetical protein
MFYLDIIAASKRVPSLAHGDAAVMTSGPDGDCTAIIAVGDTVVRSPVSATSRAAEARLFLSLTAARFGASVDVRAALVADDEAPAAWAELRVAALPHRWRDLPAVLAWAEGPTDDDALVALACKLSGGSMLTPCVVCSGPGVTREARAFAMSEAWPVGARRVCRAGWLCAVCAAGVRELVE